MVVDAPGLFVHVAPPAEDDIFEIYRISGGGGGVVLGKLFEREYLEIDERESDMPNPVAFDARLSDRISANGGAELNDRFWGAYIAFLICKPSRQISVYRDPTGAVPCQMIGIRGVTAYFVRMEDLYRIEPIALRINRHFIIGVVSLSGTQYSGETGYEGITTVLPGERVVHGRGSTQRAFLWDPFQIVNQENRCTFQSAVRDTRRIVRASVLAWASCFGPLSLQLSGGIDSTIVAACLASTARRSKVTCVNFFTNHESSDERCYAREMSSQCGFELIEVAADDRRVIDLHRRGSGTVVPVDIQSVPTAWEEVWREFAKRGISAHFRGDAGDELFHKGGSLPDAVDLAFRNGGLKSVLNVAFNDAQIERISVWEVMGLVLRHGVLRLPYDWRQRAELQLHMGLLTEDVKALAMHDETLLHPLFRGGMSCSPGKLIQVYSLLKFTSRFYVGPRLSGQPETFAPLLSQPHIEFALRTPLFMMRLGGRDRALARAAFADSIPRKIAMRRYKGLSAHRISDWVGENRSAVREMLLNGYLANEEIVSRPALERLLATVPSNRASGLASLMGYMCTEVWIRNALLGAQRLNYGAA